MTTYQKIKELCEKNGFYITNIGKVIPNLNVTGGSITGWKNGSKPKYDKLLLISEYFGVPLSYLTGETEDENTATQIPVYGEIAAGIPIEAIQNIVDYEEIPSAMAKSGEYFALQVRGNSMEPRICTGDIVIIRKQASCESGQIAAVLINGDNATLKKVIWRNNGISLVPINPQFPIQNFTSEEVERLPVRIIGVAKEVRGKL